jgi:hypothetical protein
MSWSRFAGPIPESCKSLGVSIAPAQTTSSPPCRTRIVPWFATSTPTTTSPSKRSRLARPCSTVTLLLSPQSVVYTSMRRPLVSAITLQPHKMPAWSHSISFPFPRVVLRGKCKPSAAAATASPNTPGVTIFKFSFCSILSKIGWISAARQPWVK